MKMTEIRHYLIFCLFVGWVVGDKEHSPPLARGDSLYKLLNDSSLSDLLSDPDLWLILKKRLGNIDATDDCIADRKRNDTIIKTKDSLDAGAAFISAPSVRSEQDCMNECCKDKLCNTAVLKDRSEQNQELACYLFDCKRPNVCIFTSHPGFTVLGFSLSTSSLDEHADQLDQLVVSSPTTSSVTSPTKAYTSTAKTTQTQSFSGRKSVRLFSDCQQASDCRDQHTDCLSGFCVCQQGYHVVEMQCRRDCDQELEFECANNGSPLFAECIAVYDRCDGTTQCSDGSDEVSCPDKGDVDRQPNRHPNRPIVQHLDDAKASPTPGVPSSKPTDVMKSSVVFNPTAPETLNRSVTSSSLSIKVTTTHHDLLQAAKTQETLALGTNDDLSVEKVEKNFWQMDTNQGAVVALVLGIILTTTLLILAGCRLRHFRKRYRKGRHLNSNEADYLINGMYL